MWRRGEEVFAEVALGEGEVGQAGSFGVHPALLDSALHASVLMGLREGKGGDGVVHAIFMGWGAFGGWSVRRGCGLGSLRWLVGKMALGMKATWG